MERESLVVPVASAGEEAGKLLINLPRLWTDANRQERRKLLLAMLDVLRVEGVTTAIWDLSAPYVSAVPVKRFIQGFRPP